MSSDNESDYSSESEFDPFYIEFNSDVSDDETETVTSKSKSAKSAKSVKTKTVKTKTVKSKTTARATSTKTVKKTKSKSANKRQNASKKNESGLNSIIDSTSKLSLGSKSKRLTNERKTIFYEDDPTQPVTAAGVILYRISGKAMELLLIYSRNKLEDIGGKIDKIDETIEEAAAREVEEETNGQITADQIIDRLNSAASNQKVYVKNSKYLIYLIKATNEERGLDKDDFGEYEDHDKIRRDIQWIGRDRVFSTSFIRGGKLNYRMRSKVLKDSLIHLEKSKKFTKSMFR